MTDVTSQQSESYSFRGNSVVIEALLHTRTAANCAAFLSPYLRPGMRLLDCGCGPGSITIGLAETVAPGGVIGIDVDGGSIEVARKHA
jgi:ubiquinone/menaquinone biosynthesis C-methylase UbiE